MGTVTSIFCLKAISWLPVFRSIWEISTAVTMFRPLLSVASPLRVLRPASSVRMMSGGSDKAGKGREAGGAFMKKTEGSAEDKYFRQQQQKQLETLKKSHGDEIEHHEAEIKRHQEAIARHKAKMQEMDK